MMISLLILLFSGVSFVRSLFLIACLKFWLPLLADVGVLALFRCWIVNRRIFVGVVGRFGSCVCLPICVIVLP